MTPRTNQQLAQLRMERKEQIIRAALEVFAQKGYHAANVADVAAEAGVSQGTIYHYFSSKDDLFLTAYEAWEIQSLYGEIKHSLDASNSASEQLRILSQTVGERMTQAAALLPANVEFWSHISRNDAIRTGFKKMFTEMRMVLAQIIRSGIAQGEFTDVNPEETASLMIAFYDGLILQWLADPQSINWQTISDTLVHTVLFGLLKPSKK